MDANDVLKQQQIWLDNLGNSSPSPVSNEPHRISVHNSSRPRRSRRVSMTLCAKGKWPCNAMTRQLTSKRAHWLFCKVPWQKWDLCCRGSGAAYHAEKKPQALLTCCSLTCSEENESRTGRAPSTWRELPAYADEPR